MKKRSAFFIALLSVVFIYSCRSSDDDIQFIDQVLNIYIKDAAGRDLLKGDEVGTYVNYTANDDFGLTSNAPVSLAKKMTVDSTNYLEYLAGAKREILDSISPEQKTYQSSITLSFNEKVNDTATTVVTDKLKIIYNWTPKVFEVSKVYYNDVLKFSKQPNQPNIVTIVK